MKFSKSELEQYGFIGFRSVLSLKESGFDCVSARPGVYLVFRQSDAVPEFLAESTGGTHKNRNPTVDKRELGREWVDRAQVLYIGKTHDPLRKRVAEYMKCASGRKHGHWGGRLVWQLAYCEDLLIAWKPLDREDPLDVEQALLQEFIKQYGRMPFANLRLG